MSKYTTELRYLMEQHVDIGLSDFPIFDEDYRDTLVNNITNYFYFREIGFETAGLFAFQMHTKMNLIMPYYNKLYESALLEFDPLTNYKYTEKFGGQTTDKGTLNDDNKRTVNTTSTSTSRLTGSSISDSEANGTQTINGSTDTKDKQVGSDTPQGLLNAVNLDGDFWATQAQINNQNQTQNSSNTTENKDNSTTTSESDGKDTSDSDTTDGFVGEKTHDNTGTNNYIKEIVGYTGQSPSALLEEYRKTFLNIDMMIIRELETLFMGVW